MSGHRVAAGSAATRAPVRTYVYPAGVDHPGHVARGTDGTWRVICSRCAWSSPARERLSAAAYDYAGHAGPAIPTLADGR